MNIGRQGKKVGRKEREKKSILVWILVRRRAGRTEVKQKYWRKRGEREREEENEERNVRVIHKREARK